MRKKDITNLIILAILTLFTVVGGVMIGKSMKLLAVVGAYVIFSSILFAYAKWIKKEFIIIFSLSLILLGMELFLIIKSAGLSNLVIKIWSSFVAIILILNFIATIVNFFHRRINAARIVAIILFTFFHIIIGYIMYIYISFLFLI